MKKILLPILLFAVCGALAQENLSYQKPPKEILELIDVQPVPSAMFDDNKEFMLLLYRKAFISIEELSKEELRLGGLRIDPKTNIGSRTRYVNNIRIRNLKQAGSEERTVSGLPANAQIANMSWSPDQKKVAFTNTTGSGVELWLLDVQNASARKLTEAVLNANMGDVINWFKDSNSLLVKMISDGRKELIDRKSTVPSGPTISENDGKKAQNWTYQDLLKNPDDEHNFEQLAISELYKVNINGEKGKWLGEAMYNRISFSPDGSYVMVTTIERPFSYIVTYGRFPSKTIVYTSGAKPVSTILETPLMEELPQGFDAVWKGKRNMSWRSDKPATIYFVQALDGGDPSADAEFRDEVFQLDAPFNGTPKSLFKSINRFSGIQWGNDKAAVAMDRWNSTRNTKTYIFNPSDLGLEPVILFDRNSQDSYNNPGSFVMKKNEMGSYVLALKGDMAWLEGAGFSDEGQFPFVNSINLKTGKTKEVYKSGYTDKYENIREFDPDKNQLFVSIESQTEYPNYYIRDLKSGKLTRLTYFENPFESFQNVYKEVITYKRDDGLELSGNLYLPIGYDRDKKEKMPMILWAYPREFKDMASASQNTNNPNRFVSPSWGSPVLWVTRGYVVLDGAAFPIVGEGDTEPNDLFREQLVANAKAAIDAVDKLGYIDRSKVAVGGHSYGAFMVANLLSHSDLFAAGIARSGAYNRTLTPFGFQSEERTYWDAPEVYNSMSPFMHADKMKTPMLLIHGEADNNTGTYPLQSERYFNALKGMGAIVRLVMLPMESHGYSAKESVLHVLWEQDRWLEKHLKNKPVN